MRVRATPRDSSTTGPAVAGVREYETALDAICSHMRDPVAKLRFIRESLAHYEILRRRVGWVPSAPFRRRLYVWLAIERFRPLLLRGNLPPSARRRIQRSLLLGRALVAAAGLGAIGLVGTVAVAALILIPASSARTISPHARPAPLPQQALAPPPEEPLPPTAPAAAAGVWLVEKGSNYEQYSNGLRIDTEYTVGGEPRRFHVFDDDGMRPEVYQAPVGIVFHTSESDVWPMEESFNENLRDSSQRLLRFLRRNQVYNYMIDRFGRVYRVVDDASKANHAGYSIWDAHGRHYLSLNNAFLGVCFETRWEGGRALPITAAQFTAGRNLTNCLRQRFGITAEMCVGHGLTSVNPKKHLIGHHVDWARGFPFESFGLPDQYRVPPPSVAFFGFGYDEGFLNTMGEPWPGVRSAEQALAREAERRGLSVNDVRRERQAVYDLWISEQVRDDELAASARAGKAPGRGPQGG
jgi:hypothetical protein